jgi:hypothetical protein
MMASLASFTDNPIVTFSGTLYRSDFGLGGPETPEQDHVADEVNFFGEARLLRAAV